MVNVQDKRVERVDGHTQRELRSLRQALQQEIEDETGASF